MNSSKFNYPRLTWDVTYPLPFESFWSIFAKLATFNNLNLYEISSHIAKRGHGNLRRPVRSQDSDWIDFQKFSNLLAVDEKRLRQGFLDQLGFKGLTDGPTNRQGIRTCPICDKSHYHCVLYDLELFSNCPIHGVPLSSNCKQCAQFSTFNVRERDGNPAIRYCSCCGKTLSSFEDLLLRPILSASETKEISRNCEAFLTWWGNLDSTVSGRDIVLRDLTLVGEYTMLRSDYRPSQLGLAQSKVGDIKGNWRFAFDSVPSILQSWTEGKSDIASRDFSLLHDDVFARSYAGICYKSLRRHIQKTFLGKHRGCCANLLRLRRGECLALDGEKICPLSLAFIVWRMSIEGYLRIEGLRRKRDSDHLLRFYKRQFCDMNLGAILRCLYYEFLAIWYKIEAMRLKSNIRVQLFDSADCNFFIVSKSADEVLLNGRVISAGSQYFALPPDVEPLLAQSNKRECLGKTKEDLFFWHQATYMERLHNAPNDIIHILFQIQSPRLIRRLFQYIVV